MRYLMILCLAIFWGCCPQLEAPTLIGDPLIIDNTNHGPIADAGMGQTVHVGDTALLVGIGSYDPDHDELIWEWRQLEGSEVELLSPFASITAFEAPTVPGKLKFQLIISDGQAIARDEVIVNVTED